MTKGQNFVMLILLKLKLKKKIDITVNVQKSQSCDLNIYVAQTQRNSFESDDLSFLRDSNFRSFCIRMVSMIHG